MSTSSAALPVVAVTSNLIHAGGVVTIAPRDATGPLGAFDPGNVPSVTLSRAIETATVLESRSGNFETLLSRTKSITTTIKLNIMSMTLENYALFTGSQIEEKTTSATAVASGDELLRGARRGGSWYLGVSSSYPEGHRALTSFASLEIKATARANSTAYAIGDVISASSVAYVVTVAGTSGASPPTYPTAGATASDGTATIKHLGPTAIATGDYVVSLTAGLLTLIGTTSDINTSIERMPSGYTLTLLPAYTPTATAYQRLIPRSTTQEYTLRFNGQSSTGEPLNFVVPYCTIVGEGDSEWINSDNPQSFSLTVTALKRDSANDSVIPFGDTKSLPWT